MARNADEAFWTGEREHSELSLVSVQSGSRGHQCHLPPRQIQLSLTGVVIASDGGIALSLSLTLSFL